MSNVSSTPATDVLPTSLRNGDPSGRLVNCQPARVGKLASDVTLEGSLLNGAVQGAEAVRTVIGVARQLYEPQDLAFVALGGQRLYRGLHGRGPRRTGCGRPRGHFQRRRRHPEHRRQLSAAQGLDVCSRLLRQELLQHFRGNLGNWEPAVMDTRGDRLSRVVLHGYVGEPAGGSGAAARMAARRDGRDELTTDRISAFSQAFRLGPVVNFHAYTRSEGVEQ